jgi:hypothetical protein
VSHRHGERRDTSLPAEVHREAAVAAGAGVEVKADTVGPAPADPDPDVFSGFATRLYDPELELVLGGRKEKRQLPRQGREPQDWVGERRGAEQLVAGCALRRLRRCRARQQRTHGHYQEQRCTLGPGEATKKLEA